jgi:hypothetical protein
MSRKCRHLPQIAIAHAVGSSYRRILSGGLALLPSLGLYLRMTGAGRWVENRGQALVGGAAREAHGRCDHDAAACYSVAS